MKKYTCEDLVRIMNTPNSCPDPMYKLNVERRKMLAYFRKHPEELLRFKMFEGKVENVIRHLDRGLPFICPTLD